MEPLSDFAVECREAFVRHCLERDKIDPAEPGHRNLNAARRALLVERIDAVLDQYLDWREVETLERELAA